MSENRWQAHSDKQERALFSTKKITLCATGIQWGKGLPLDSLVLTPMGYKTVGSIKVGDLLIDRCGDYTAVKGVYPQGEQQLYRIKLGHNISFVTDQSHLNILKPRSGRDEIVISTEELFKRNHLWGKAQIPALEPINFNAKTQTIKPYTMGVLLGDGGLTSSLRVTSADAEIIERLSAELLPGYQIRNVDKYDYQISSIERKSNEKGHVYSDYINELKVLGVWGKTSLEKFVPDSYKYGSINQRLDLLRGLMDADGYIEKNKRIEFCSSSEHLAKDVIWLVESLGGKAWLKKTKIPKYRYKGELKTGAKSYRVNIILKRFNPFYLSRKAENYFKHENTENKIIESVEKIGVGETVCFEVSSSTKSFVIENQIVTHNTTVGAYFLKLLMHKYRAQDDAFILCAPNYKIFNQSSLPAFLATNKDCGRYNKADASFSIYGGGTVYFRTGTEPDSIVGITNVRGIWGDEAGKYSLYFWENIQGRASFKDCPIILTTSPYSMNWVYTDLIKPVKKGSRDDVELIQAASIENPYFPEAEYYRQQELMDPRRFQMMYGGVFDKMEGLVYDCFDSDMHQCEPIDIPEGSVVVAGIDWGFTAPFVIKVRAIFPNGDHYAIAELYKTGLTPSAKKEAARKLMDIHNIRMFYADPEEAGTIEEFNIAGIPTVAANNDIRRGIDLHYEMIKAGRYKLFKGRNPHTLDEYENYHYPEPEDAKPDKDMKDQKPVKQHDHAMDAERYITIATYYTGQRKPPKINVEEHIPRQQETYEQRLKRIKRSAPQGWEKFS